MRKEMGWRGFAWLGVRWLGAAMLWIVVALCLAVTVVPRFLDRIYYHGPASGHFNGARFANPDEGEGEFPTDPTRAGQKVQRSAPIGFLRWALGMDDGRPAWPERVTTARAAPRDLPPLAPGQMRATWVGHATVLIETPGMTILTDPIWSDYAGRWGIGPERVARPGIAFDDLPKIDLVVVSHNHYDHMDLPTLKRLWDRDRPLIVTSLGNDAILADAGIASRALDWGAALPVGPGRVTVTRNHHWGSRWGVDRNRAFWSSFVIDTPSGAVFFAGDTGPGNMRWPAEARARAAGPIRLAIIPIGAFRFTPGQMWSGSHIGPRHAVAVFQGTGAAYGLPMHWGTFRLSWEAYATPPRMLRLEAECAGLPRDAFAARSIGVPFLVPARAPVARGTAACDRKAIDALP